MDTDRAPLQLADELHKCVEVTPSTWAVLEKAFAGGLSFLILDGNDRIHLDLQFNPTVDEAGEFADRYLAVLNEEAEDVQRNRLIELWAPDATYVGEQSAKYGHADLLTGVRQLEHNGSI